MTAHPVVATKTLAATLAASQVTATPRDASAPLVRGFYWGQVAGSATMVALGALLGALLLAGWDLWKEHKAWHRHRQTLVMELKANQVALETRFKELPEEIRNAVEAAWAGGEVNLSPDDLQKLPSLFVPVDLRATAWESIVALGLVPRLAGDRDVVVDAYEKTMVANQMAAFSLPLYELSLNPAADQAQCRQAAQLMAVFPHIQCLPAVRTAVAQADGGD